MVIRERDRDALLQALRAGVVPRTGQYLVQVGRKREVEALLADVERVARGGASFRVVVGEYGAGKTFFLNQVRDVALQKKLVAAYADLHPDRRLQATGGQARSLYSELMKNMATRAKPEGGALTGVVEKFITLVLEEAKATNQEPERVIFAKCSHLTEMVNGYDFAAVIAAYWKGYDQGNDQLKQDAIRWLRGEFSTKTEARQALGVRNIVEDSGFYDQLKLMAAFVRLAGYEGMIVGLDELVNLYKLANTAARNANYEQVLRILNDVLQGSVEGLGFIFGCTPESLMDPRRGIFSYQALQSRLAENGFARGDLVDYNDPVLRLAALTPEDLYMLLENIRHVYASGDPAKYLLPDEAIEAFMTHGQKRVGDVYFRTPRETTKDFIHLLSLLEQYPDTPWDSLIEKLPVTKSEGGAAELVDVGAGDAVGDDLVDFKL
jgi:hypothetical protein